MGCKLTFFTFLFNTQYATDKPNITKYEATKEMIITIVEVEEGELFYVMHGYIYVSSHTSKPLVSSGC